MAEAVYNAAGLGLPIVMTIGNRAIGAPINIWNDHSDSMSMRDAGLDPAVRGNQPGSARPAHPGVPPGRGAVVSGHGLHGRLHPDPRVRTGRRADAGGRSTAYLPPYEPRQILDPVDPVSIGAMVGPEAFTEVRYLSHHKQLRALALLPELAAAFKKQFGRDSGGLIRAYRTEDAETIVVALGSVNGTVQEVVDEMRTDGSRIGSVSICSFRPFPLGRCARRCSTRSASSSSKSAWRSAWAASYPTACASRCRASRSTATPSSRVLAGARSRARR